MKLAINMVTRGRASRMADSLRQTIPLMRDQDTRLMVSIDDDDHQAIDAIRIFEGDVILCVRPREDSLGEKYNRVLGLDADVYMSMNDSAPFVTPGFDVRITEAAKHFPDGIGVVFTHLGCASFAQQQGITKGLIDFLGWMYPPYFPYWFVDHWIDDIARLIDRVSFADAWVEVRRDKPPTSERRDVAFWATFYDVCYVTRRKQARAIIDSPKFIEADWRKDVMRRHHPLIEVRSQWVNSILRAEAKNLEASANAGDGGERYQRLKQKALIMLDECVTEIHASERTSR